MKAASDAERKLMVTAAARIPRGTTMFQMSVFEDRETGARHIALVPATSRIAMKVPSWFGLIRSA